MLWMCRTYMRKNNKMYDIFKETKDIEERYERQINMEDHQIILNKGINFDAYPKPETCSACEKPLTDGVNTRIGFSINLYHEADELEESSFSPYKPQNYAICVGCLLFALGVPLPETET